MSKKYNEVMEHITVTHQMHERIMSNIEKMSLHETKQKKTLRFSSIKIGSNGGLSYNHVCQHVVTAHTAESV